MAGAAERRPGGRGAASCPPKRDNSIAAVFERTGRGEVLFAPVDVELTAADVVEPDFVVVLAEPPRSWSRAGSSALPTSWWR